MASIGALPARPAAAVARADDAPPDALAMARECIVCGEGTRRHALVPCGHLAACTECLNKMLNDQGHVLLGHALRCPLCNGPVADVLKAYT